MSHQHNLTRPPRRPPALYHGDHCMFCQSGSFTVATWETSVSHSSQSPEERDSSASTLKNVVFALRLIGIATLRKFFRLDYLPRANDAELSSTGEHEIDLNEVVQHASRTRCQGTRGQADEVLLSAADTILTFFISRFSLGRHCDPVALARLAFLSACQFVAK